jgi:uncharacterized membrane protein YjgN (DUF898 family)
MGRGRPFDCSGCGRKLVVSKSRAALAIAVLALLSFLSERVPLLAIIVLLVGAVLVEWLLVKVELVEELSPGS